MHDCLKLINFKSIEKLFFPSQQKNKISIFLKISRSSQVKKVEKKIKSEAKRSPNQRFSMSQHTSFGLVFCFVCCKNRHGGNFNKEKKKVQIKNKKLRELELKQLTGEISYSSKFLHTRFNQFRTNLKKFIQPTLLHIWRRSCYLDYLILSTNIQFKNIFKTYIVFWN